MKKLLFLLILASSAQAAPIYTLNVTISTSTASPDILQKDLMAMLTTGQYLGTSKINPFFSNTYGIVINGKNPNYVPTSNPPPDNFLYGYANGTTYERASDMEIVLSKLSQCAEPKDFNLFDPSIPNCNAISNNSIAVLSAYASFCESSTQYSVLGTSIPVSDCTLLITNLAKSILRDLKSECDNPESVGYVESTSINCTAGLSSAYLDIGRKNCYGEYCDSTSTVTVTNQ